MVGTKIGKIIVKEILMIAFILLSLQTIFAQDLNKSYKFAEYESPRGGSCDEYFRMVDFLAKINQEKESKGLIVIYSGNSSERFGNLLAYTF